MDTLNSYLKWGKSKMWKVMHMGGKTAWIFVTASIITVIPLVFEIEREGQVIELEKLQVKSLQEQGYTLQQIAQSGLTVDHEPAVVADAQGSK
mmetsp:Transcript_16906/g.24780  ORF Transcript_16906/g.24780 Transcript_16906/m.24780 type:complete len:93 (-) Transcript_16906:143-421(-)|eukprot:CAMPEP_0113937922 /NCGR_PEP_ID=MMETSP1339-20121228/4408_1 /TAXON_ID=94617 /ORGANISM="Fibrocapsa japonica" /LENGTH=92 /DNA_ID=CAMNT_0000940837 /DNA_START=37 /DNA_END=315 /DNA_ORIENTATION=+ /assembly_acc=CAM_ASM_000762